MPTPVPTPIGTKTNYIQGSDLVTFLANSGFDVSGLDTNTAAEMAANEFEERTGRIPMIAPYSTFDNTLVGVTKRVFDPPTGPKLMLNVNNDMIRGDNGALQDTIDAEFGAESGMSEIVETGIAAGTINGLFVTVSGTANYENQDYWLRPYDIEVQSKPFNLVEFNLYKWPMRAAYSLPQWKKSIAVYAAWGYWRTLPSSAWTAMLQLGGIYLMSDLPSNSLQSLQKVQQIDASESWDPGLTATQRIEGWRLQSDKVINNFMRQLW